jgi:predicted dehydrogenase
MVKQPITRREFIGATAAAGAGLLLTSCGPDSSSKAAGPKSMLSNLNIALIGCGAEGQVLLDSLVVIEGIKLLAIVDIWNYNRDSNIRRLKAQGVEVNGYENYEDLLAHEKDLQAVIVATPDFWHAPITNACLKAGLHVYCEKMMSNTIEGARSMVETMRETGKLLQIGHQRRSNPRYMFALKRLVEDAKICGRLTAANSQWNRAVAEDLGWPKKIRHVPRGTGQTWLQGHASVPELALVQGPWRWPVV